jgi:hypothetical protein
MSYLHHKPVPKIVRPLKEEWFLDIQTHIRELRRVFDWPGVAYHDKSSDPHDVFNRWVWYNLPLLVRYHHDPQFIAYVSDLAGRPVKPTYVFTSMYGADGICPLHVDRPQCQFSVDMLVASNHKDKPWPIYVEDEPYILERPGDAVFYSGTGQKHYRNPMKEESDATKVDLVFFHFAPIEWQGELK